MSREGDWAVFEKAVELTASAVRGALGGQGSQPASFVADVFREAYAALTQAASEMPDRSAKPGF